MVAFLLGCSFSFEGPMLEAGLEIRHITDHHNVPMYITNQECIRREYSMSHGGIHRPMKPEDAVRAVQITARMPYVHGAPVFLGDPEKIGIHDLSKPDFGDFRNPSGRNSCILGLRCHSAGGGHDSQARYHDYPCAGPYVHYRYTECLPGSIISSFQANHGF